MMWTNKQRGNWGFLFAVLVGIASHSASGGRSQPASALASRTSRHSIRASSVTSVKESTLPGLFRDRHGQGSIAYTDASGRYFLFGHLFDMSCAARPHRGAHE